MPRSFEKDPDAVLDYKFDWANTTNGGDVPDWLASGDTISTASVTAESGLTLDSDEITDTNTSVTIWLSGGTARTTYDVTCHIVTAAGREDDRTIKVYVREK